MTRLLLITLLTLLCSGPAYAEWVKVTGNAQEDATLYVNPDTIRRKEEMVRMWVLTDYKTIRTVRGESYLSTKGQEEYDCDGEHSRYLTLMVFSGNMGGGKAVYSTPRESAWEPVELETVGHVLWKFACDKK
jgi:hypothetical protein